MSLNRLSPKRLGPPRPGLLLARLLLVRLLLPSLLLMTLLITAGCASAPLASSDCRSVKLETGPAWMAGAAWDSAGERLVMVDPGTQTLLVYDPDGELLQRASHGQLEALDFHHPVRIEADEDGFVLGDRNQLLWLDGEFEQARTIFEGVDGVHGVHLADWTRTKRSIVAFADMEVDDETWNRGFVRFERGDDFTMLEQMPLERGGEYERYYTYGLRPYVASVGRRIFVLRYQEPSTVYRAGRSGLDLLWRIDDAASRVDGFGAGRERLFGWDDGLYLLESVERAVEDEGAIEAPEPLESSGGASDGDSSGDEPDTLVIDEKAVPSAAAREAIRAALLSGQMVKKTTKDWYLSRLDTKNGGREWRRRLISGVDGSLTVVPGRQTWALVSHSGIATASHDGLTVVHSLPAGAIGPGALELDLCSASSHGVQPSQ